MNTDRFYTPTKVARKLVQYSAQEKPLYVADFCAGRGELLKVAKQRWPRATFIALELSKSNVAALKSSAAAQQIIHCNFLNPCRRHARLLDEFHGKMSVILLNPPFSYRGGTKYTIAIGDKLLTCSPAMGFVLRAFDLLSDDGEIVAILPAGCLRTEKDEGAWNYLRISAQTNVVGNNGHRAFPDCVVHTVLVRIQKCRERTLRKSERGNGEPLRGGREAVELFRGKIPMYTVASRKGRSYFVHTTDIHRGMVVPVRKISSSEFSISGPLILISRVGQPSVGKVVIYSGVEKLALSDCVLALRCKSFKATQRLHSRLLESWDALKAKYSGTGAPFLTVRLLAEFLRDRGYAVHAFQGAPNSHQFLRALGD